MAIKDKRLMLHIKCLPGGKKMSAHDDLTRTLEYELGDVDIDWAKTEAKATQALIFSLENDGPTYITLLDNMMMPLKTDVYPII